MTYVSNIATVLNVLLALGGAVALAWVFNKQRSRDLSDLQAKIIETQKEALATLDLRAKTLEATVAKQSQTLSTVKALVRQRGVIIRVDGDFVTIEDRRADKARQTTARIPDVGNPVLPEQSEDDPDSGETKAI